MNKVGFFDKVKYQNPVSAFIEDYLFIDRISKGLGGKKLSEVSHDNKTIDLKEEVYKSPSWKRTTVNILKFLSWGTIFLPLVAVAIREGLRHSHTFNIQESNTQSTRLSKTVLEEQSQALSIPELYQKLQKELRVLPPATGLSEDQMRAEFAKLEELQIFQDLFEGNWKALDLSLFPNLKILRLFDPSHKGRALPNIEACKHLEELFIAGFGFEEIPSQISSSTKLKKLDLEHNPIKKFDLAEVLKLQNLPELEEFVLHGTSDATPPTKLTIPNDGVLVDFVHQHPALKNIRITYCGFDNDLRNNYDMCVPSDRCKLETYA